MSYVLKLISGTWSGKTYRSWSSDTSLNHLNDAPIENVINGCNEIHILVVEVNAEVDGDDHVLSILMIKWVSIIPGSYI